MYKTYKKIKEYENRSFFAEKATSIHAANVAK